MSLISEEKHFVAEIDFLVYPKYQPACSTHAFLQEHLPLFEALATFDSRQYKIPHTSLKISNFSGINGKENEQSEQQQRMTMAIIEILNKSLSHCHRKQYSLAIFEEIANFKGNLKWLAVGKSSIRISNWNEHIEIDNPINLYYAIKQPTVLQILDNYYIEERKIPHRETLLLKYPHLLIAKDKFQEALKSTEEFIPADHRYYLAIIAASTYGSKYLWNQSVRNFIKVGGDVEWIKSGVSAAPTILQEMSKYSVLMAYNFKQMFELDIFYCSSGNDQYKLKGLLLLSYYHILASMDLIFGFIPENTHYENQYLPKILAISPSAKSFEAIKQVSNNGHFHQLKKSEQFANLFAWDDIKQRQNKQNLKTNLKPVKQIRFKRISSIKKRSQFSRIESSPNLAIRQSLLLSKDQKDYNQQKVKKSQTLKHLRSVFSKYADFSHLQQNVRKSNKQNAQGQSIQDWVILGSDWQYSIKGLNMIQSVLGARFRQSLQNLISSLSDNKSEQRRTRKRYYEFVNNYMHEHINYTNLVMGLSRNEKNYLKLITKSPFLFNGDNFKKMKVDIEEMQVNGVQFVLQALSFKLQLNATLISYVFGKVEECQ